MSGADNGLRALFKKHLPEFLWSPIETGGTTSGVPDAYYVHPRTGVQGWVESKATDGWSVTVRPFQYSWIVPRVAAGVRVTLAVRASGKGSAKGAGDSLHLVRGEAIGDLRDEGLKLPTQFVLGRWYGAPRTWDWKAVEEILTRG